MPGKSAVSSSKRMEMKLRDLGRSLEGLVAKTRRAESAARVRYAKELKVLKTKERQVKKVVARLQRRSAAAGDPLKVGFKRAWEDLSAAVREASRRYRETD